MFLVAGLAVAGLVGIAAAFYFSIRSGNRVRSAGAGRAGAARRPGGRNSTSRPDPNGRPRRAASNGGPATTFRPAAVSSRNPGGAAHRPGDRQAPPEDPWPGDAVAAESWSDDSRPCDSWPDDPLPGDPAATDPKLRTVGRGAGEARPAARLSRDAHAAAAGDAARPRRRVGFRKGADLDEELWPAETFGGVSDEQFWDDLASDKPLATTARAALQDSAGKNRSAGSASGTGFNTGPATDPQAIQAQAEDRKREDRAPGRGRRESGSGAYAAPRTGPDPAAERTAIQPAYAATQPVQSMKPPLPGATQPVRAAASASQPMSTASQPGAMSQPREATTPPRGTATQPREATTPPRGTAVQPRGATTKPAETRRRRPSSAEEDPLTSAAFSLRPSGPVDGRSSLRARNASPYPNSTPSYEDPSSVTQTMATPPYGQDYGYGRGTSAARAGEPRHKAARSHARPDGTGEGTTTARPAHPRHSRQATGSYQPTGSYPATGSYQATGSNQVSGGYPGNGSYSGNGYQGGGYQAGSYPAGGYPGNGHRGNGHRAPYDPRDDYRRLTPQH